MLNSTTTVVPGAGSGGADGTNIGDWAPLADALGRCSVPVFADLGHLHAASPMLTRRGTRRPGRRRVTADMPSVIRLARAADPSRDRSGASEGAAPRLFPLLVSTSRHGAGDVADLRAILAETPVKPFLVDGGFLAHDPPPCAAWRRARNPPADSHGRTLMRTARAVASRLEHIARVTSTRDRRLHARRRQMTDLDYALIKRLQAELGRLRQDDILVAARRTSPRSPAQMPSSTARHSSSASSATTSRDWPSRAASRFAWEARQDLVEALEARLFGAGSLQALLDDENVENIDINGFQHVYVEYADGTTAKVRPVAGSDEELVETIQTLAAHEGLSARAFDVANVRVNLRLPDGSRLYAVQSVTKQPVVSIRRHRHTRVTLKDLVGLETIDQEMAEFLSALVQARKNVMVAGATSAGKTTLLRALASEIGPEERILTVERSLELGLDEDVEHHPNAIAFEERLPNTEGAGAVTMAELVRDTLRMNPSRVIVGEVLGDEVVTMLNAMTQGNDGSLSTIHANSSSDVVHKIATYAIQAPERLPWEATVRLVATALDFIVFIRRVRGEDGQRRVVESIREIAGISDDGQLQTNELWGPDPRRATSYGDTGCRSAPRTT